MIYLEKDINRAKEQFALIDKHSFLTATIGHYLDVYGLLYEFQELYIQKTDEEEICSFLLRYNSLVYCFVTEASDMEELIPFVFGFTGCEIISNVKREMLLELGFQADILYDMKRQGNPLRKVDEGFLEIKSNAVSALSILKEYLSPSKYEDFLLNMSYQHRHGILKVFASDEYSCVTGVTDTYSDVKTISFLYTKKDFRGNKLAQKILNFACSEASEYYLICEETNLKFYEKCDFIQASTFSKIQL